MSMRSRRFRPPSFQLKAPALQGSVMRRLLAVAAAVTLCAWPLLGAGAAEAAAGARVNGPATAQINGSGSSWAANAIDLWIYNVKASEGLQVVFTDSGSAQGRTDFRNYTNDFGVSDIGFQGTDPRTGTNDSACQNTSTNPPSDCRAYVYLPIVAGGTTFPYQIRVAGRLVDSLRLSGETLAKIFTNQITNWDDPAIAKDNNGHFYLAGGGEVSALPSLPIIPVVHSEGSGSTAMFTMYLDTLFPSLWRPFASIPSSTAAGSGFTEYWPRQGSQIAQNGSDGIINYVTSAAANGSIGFDEYSYALDTQCSGCGPNGWPVALVENSAGYFTAPTQYNVAVALTKAQINMNKGSPNYLLQNLSQVYTNPDKRTYPLSSYSYMIIPTSSTDQTMSTPKRQTLADFIDWSICGGQAEMGQAGYSPLPINLAQASFAQMDKLHSADKSVQISTLNIAKDCNNPTFWAGHPDGNYLAEIAPNPASCDQSGQGPCTAADAVGARGNPKNGKAPPAPTSSSSTSPSSGTTGSTSPSPGSSSGTSSDTGAGGTGTTSDDGTGGTGSSEALVGTPTSLAASEGTGYGGWLAALAALEVLLLLAIPPIIVRRRQGRGFGRGSGKGSER
jgi:phosphate transport system substrate-binding protein